MNLSLRRTKPLGALVGLALPWWQGGHPGAPRAGGASRAGFSPPHIRSFPLPLAASCLWPPTVVSSPRQPVLGGRAAYLALSVRVSCGEAGAAVPAAGILLCNRFARQKRRDPSPPSSCLSAKALVIAFSARLELMFASPPVPKTDRYVPIGFSHQNIYFSNRTPSSQTNGGLHGDRLPRFGSKQEYFSLLRNQIFVAK